MLKGREGSRVPKMQLRCRGETKMTYVANHFLCRILNLLSSLYRMAVMMMIIAIMAVLMASPILFEHKYKLFLTITSWSLSQLFALFPVVSHLDLEY